MAKVKVDFRQVEELIDKEIEELEKEYDLDDRDIAEIRKEIYTANGWYGDPFKEEEEEEEDETYYPKETLASLGFTCWDFL